MGKKGFYWFCIIYILIFVGFNDFWNWGQYEPMYGGWLPRWVLWHLFLIVCCGLAVLFLGQSVQSFIGEKYQVKN